jgi:hypothetical protein
MHFRITTIIHDLNCVIAHNVIRAFHVLLQSIDELESHMSLKTRQICKQL